MKLDGTCRWQARQPDNLFKQRQALKIFFLQILNVQQILLPLVLMLTAKIKLKKLPTLKLLITSSKTVDRKPLSNIHPTGYRNVSTLMGTWTLSQLSWCPLMYFTNNILCPFRMTLFIHIHLKPLRDN